MPNSQSDYLLNPLKYLNVNYQVSQHRFLESASLMLLTTVHISTNSEDNIPRLYSLSKMSFLLHLDSYTWIPIHGGIYFYQAQALLLHHHSQSLMEKSYLFTFFSLDKRSSSLEKEIKSRNLLLSLFTGRHHT